MDFLDPKKKQQRKIRLAIGHVLMALMVFTATYILVFQAYGYDFDRKTGEVIQNGLVYIDSAPDGAKIKINGEERKSTTNTRISLPEGKYDLEISKDGYRDWKRGFDLEGGEVLRFAYPLLFPVKLNPAQVQAFTGPIGFATQSPDRKWILIGEKNKLTAMTLYDLGKIVNGKPVPTTLAFPSGLFKASSGNHVIKLVEWSTDNRHVLVRHNFKGGQEFVILDREQPAQSYNVNKKINRSPAQVNLFDKKFDRLFVYDSATRILTRADIATGSLTPFANGVISYKSHGDDTILMSVADGKNKSKANVVMRQNGKDNLIKKIPMNKSIPLDIARYGNNWYAVIGVQSEKRAYIYKDPLGLLADSRNDIDSVRAIVLRTTGPIDEVSFSQNTRFIMSSSKQNFSVYDSELERRYTYTINQKIDTAQKPAWMDGNRIMANSGGKILVFDYDGINIQTLVDADPALPVMFSRDYTDMYSLGASASSKGKYSLYLTSLRLPADK
jgi:hypothetical protein